MAITYFNLGTVCVNLRKVQHIHYTENVVTVIKTMEFKDYLLQISHYCCNIYIFTV